MAAGSRGEGKEVVKEASDALQLLLSKGQKLLEEAQRKGEVKHTTFVFSHSLALSISLSVSVDLALSLSQSNSVVLSRSLSLCLSLSLSHALTRSLALPRARTVQRNWKNAVSSREFPNVLKHTNARSLTPTQAQARLFSHFHTLLKTQSK